MNMRSNTYIFDNRLFVDWYSTEEIREICTEEAMMKKWLEVEATLAETQAALGIIPGWAATAIRTAVSDIDLDLASLTRDIDEIGHVLVPVIRELERRVGEAGRFVHMGATTQDILDTAVSLQLKQIYEIIYRDLVGIIYRLSELAQEHRVTVMMGRTHGVHALPTTLGFKFSVWIGELLRHLERLDQSKPRVLVGQLGGAVGTMAGFGPNATELRHQFMANLGLNTPDIAWQAARDSITEFVLLAGFLGGTLGKMADEIARLQATEIGELAEPSSSQTVGSSTMPHKKNPLKSEVVVAVSKLLQGLVSTALASLHTRSERDSTTWSTEYYLVPQAASLIAAQLQAMSTILNGLVVEKERMRQNAELLNGMPYSENLMLQLAESLGRDKAHEVVSRVARQAFLEGEDFRKMAMVEPDIVRILNEKQVRDALQSNSYLGKAPAEVDRMVKKARNTLQARQISEEQRDNNN